MLEVVSLIWVIQCKGTQRKTAGGPPSLVPVVPFHQANFHLIAVLAMLQLQLLCFMKC